jgi:hypothetical protein
LPPAVIFRFDEPVEGNFGAVRVYDANGSRVDEGDAFHPNGEGPRLGVHLKPGLPDGSYTATYRVISADGHIVSSGFVFSIGKPGKTPKETVSELMAGSGSGPVTEVAFGFARGLQYVAIALAIGGPSTDEPAPQNDVTAAGGVLQDVAGSETAPPSPAAEAATGAEAAGGSSSGDSASKGLGIAALVVGALGLLAGGVALVRSRRTT